MLLRILIVALCCTLVSCKDLVEKYKRSSSGVSALDKRVLYDARFSTVHSDGALSPAAPPDCTVPLADAQGSFTYAAEQEQAVLYRCTGTNKLIVFSARKVQASSDTPYSDIIGTFDLNHDDKNEFLLMVETTHNGEISREASLDNFEKNSLRAVEDFGIVYHDPCALFLGATEPKRKELTASGQSPYIEALRISYLPHPGHEMPSFTAQRLRAPCPTTPGAAPSDWQLVSPK
jgi:hypothetical protein